MPAPVAHQVILAAEALAAASATHVRFDMVVADAAVDFQPLGDGDRVEEVGGESVHMGLREAWQVRGGGL